MTKPMNVRVDTDHDCRTWLRAHGYGATADIITRIMAKWEERGVKTRRDWWLVLAGTPEGERRSVEGYIFPMLKAARRRQGYPPDVKGAVQNSKHELAPSIKQQAARWGKTFKRAMR